MPKRWLPDGVTDYRDRHGKARYRFRKTGYKTHHFKAEPGTEGFRAEYAAALTGTLDPLPIGIDRIIPDSIDDMCVRYYRSTAWKKMAANSQATYRGIIERFRNRKKKSGQRYGDLPVAAMTTAHIDSILGDMAHTPAAANNLRKVLKRLFRIAVKSGLRTDNPVTETDTFKKGKGFHTWTEEEIAKYRERWPLGTKARLALELALNTAGRRCEVATLRRDQLVDGIFFVQHAKDNDATEVGCWTETKAAIDAMPVAGLGHFLVTDYGKPFSVVGFGNKFKEWCRAANLPHCTIHGVRKAISRRLAESDATDAQGRSITGQKKNETFAYYASKANRRQTARDAVEKLERRGLANRPLANPENEG